jgi:hypothetical protein
MSYHRMTQITGFKDSLTNGLRRGGDTISQNEYILYEFFAFLLYDDMLCFLVRSLVVFCLYSFQLVVDSQSEATSIMTKNLSLSSKFAKVDFFNRFKNAC